MLFLVSALRKVFRFSENQLGEKIENVSQFLQELIAQKTEICNMKTGEINIRNYITTKFQSNYEELKIIVLSYEAEVQRGHDKSE